MAKKSKPILRASALAGSLLCGSASLATAQTPACAALTKLVDRQAGPAFVVSFPDLAAGPLTGVAFTYDNAVAAIALVSCGEAQTAARIADALLAAQDHDRYWHDGRLRNGYLAGPVTDDPLKLPGWWDDTQNMWVEDQYQMGSDSGNQAWAMLALLALYRAGAGSRYLVGAERIGAYVEKSFDTRAPLGFMGGTFGDEPAPVLNSWKSTEHNTDLAAAFTLLAQATGETRWRTRAEETRKFADAMWTPACGCFAVGTAADGQTVNPLLALDAQVFPLLALPREAAKIGQVAETMETRLKMGDGFSYSEVKEGVWTEGTAQAALLFELAGRERDAQNLLAAIHENQTPDGSYYAADLSQIATGFMLQTDPTQPRLYFHLSHLAALSWTALAQERFNPFIGKRALP